MWQPLPPMAHARSGFGAVAVAGGLLAVGGRTDNGVVKAPDELVDEASERWFELPHPMAQPRNDAAIVSLPAPAPALAQPPEGAAP